jgi:predicted aminopeptidase
MTTRYIVQAGFGQLDLWSRGRTIEEVLDDRDTDERTKVLLEEVGHIRKFATAQGLKTKGNYEHYVELDRPAVIWFLTASKELAFEPRLWTFPIVGSFPYTGWFDREEAIEMYKRLERDGWDVYVRRVRAYSTGGWFNDPVLSTMLSHEDDAFRSLANVLFHELTHANILINNQSTYNESIASFVGDQMADEYLLARFGAESEELKLFREENAEYHMRGAGLAAVYKELETLYASTKSDAVKRKEKRRILLKTEVDLQLQRTPNNASLTGFKTYNAGLKEFAQLYKECGRKWSRFFAAVRTLDEGSFDKEQLERIGPVIGKLIMAHCPQK